MHSPTLKTFQCWAFALVLLALSNVAEANSSLFAKYVSKTLHKQNDTFLESMLGGDAFRNATSGQETSGHRRSLLEAPSSWTCYDSFYDTLDGCDCNCGAYDPDCYWSSQELHNCASGEYCSGSGVCTPSSPSSSSSYCDESFVSGYAAPGCSLSDMCEAYTCAVNTCSPGDNVYYGDCGAFGIKSERWCDICGEPTCCAWSDGGCCDTDGGAVAGLVIGMVVFLVASITSCAYCCKCCCFRPRPAVLAVAVQQPTFIQQPIPVVAHGTPVQHYTSIQMSSTPPSKETSEQKSTPVKAFCPKCGAAVAGAAFCPSCGQNQ
jgi:hypothetical protein